MNLNEPSAALRTLRVAMVDAITGLPPAAPVTLSVGDAKIQKFGGSLANSVNLPVQLSGAQNGAMLWLIDTTEVDTLGPFYYQVTHAGLRVFYDFDLVQPPSFGQVFQVVSDVGNTALTFKTNLALTDHADSWVSFISGTLVEQAHRILSFDPVLGFVTMVKPFTGIPAALDRFVLVNK